MRELSENFLSVVMPRLSSLEDIKNEDSPGELITFLNPYSYLVLRGRPSVLIEFDRICLDGQALVLLFSLLGLGKVMRTSFDYTSLAAPVFENAVLLRKRIFIVGSTEAACSRFASVIAERHPGLQLAGFRNGYFLSQDELSEAVQKIAALAPDIVICGMGAGLQEEFLVKLRASGWTGTGFTCGGFIHQTASKGGAYYPPLVDKMNLRFLYRIYDEPQLVKRYCFDYGRAFLLLFQDVLRYRRGRAPV